MALDGCALVCKYILIIFNFIFAVLGGAFVGLGLLLMLSPSTSVIFETEALNSSVFVRAVKVLIAVGLVMLIVIAFGDLGARKEKRWALNVFSFLLAILATTEITVGMIAYPNIEQVELSFVELYRSMYALYLRDPDITATLTFIHKMLDCCGVTWNPLMDLDKGTCPNRLSMPACAGIIADVFDSKAPLVLFAAPPLSTTSIFTGTGSLLIVALICSTVLCNRIPLQSTSSPKCDFLTQPTSVPASHKAAQHEFVSTSYSHPDKDAVVFTPLTMANIPVAQA